MNRGSLPIDERFVLDTRCGSSSISAYRASGEPAKLLSCFKQLLEQTSHDLGVQKSRGELEVNSWRDIGWVWECGPSVQRKSFIRRGAPGALLVTGQA